MHIPTIQQASLDDTTEQLTNLFGGTLSVTLRNVYCLLIDNVELSSLRVAHAERMNPPGSTSHRTANTFQQNATKTDGVRSAAPEVSSGPSRADRISCLCRRQERRRRQGGSGRCRSRRNPHQDVSSAGS